MPRICAACGGALSANSHGNRKFCKACVPSSSATSWRLVNQRKVAAYNAARRKPVVEKTCEECGVRFATSRNSGKIVKRYCSADCRETVRGRRPGTRSATPTTTTRRKILERDGWHCYLCGRAIDRSYKWPHPLAPSVDHVIPYSVCRSSRMDNLRAAHWQCNLDKGDALPGTEVWVPAEAA